MAREISLDAKKGITELLRYEANEADKRAKLAWGHHAVSGLDGWIAQRDRYRRWAREIENIDEIGTEGEG